MNTTAPGAEEIEKALREAHFATIGLIEQEGNGAFRRNSPSRRPDWEKSVNALRDVLIRAGDLKQVRVDRSGDPYPTDPMALAASADRSDVADPLEVAQLRQAHHLPLSDAERRLLASANAPSLALAVGSHNGGGRFDDRPADQADVDWMRARHGLPPKQLV